MQRFDDVVIGTGQAGPSLAARLTAAGRRVAIIERKRFGGTCVNVGCIPTKTLVASARAARDVARAAEYGVVVGGPVHVDMRRVKARKDAVVQGFTRGIEEWLRAMPGCTVYTGHARFVGPRTVRVGEDVLAAERVFVNVGARAASPPVEGLCSVPHFDSSTMLDVDFLPEHLVIVGGSYIGLEFAQVYRRFGARVTVVEMGPRLIGREDADVAGAVRDLLAAEGIDVRLDARCIRVERRGNGVAVGLDCAAGAPEVLGSHVLIAAGRRPNTDDLGLDTAGVDVDTRGYIVVDDALRTSAEGVWALGDCNGRGAFTHTSYNDHEIVADNLLGGASRRAGDRVTAYALYIDPPLGRAGMTEAEVRRSGREALIGTKRMDGVTRAVARGETAGLMKVLVDARTRRLLGAALLGIGGDELVHVLLDLMYAGAPVDVVQRAMHIHPTVAEALPSLCTELRPLQ